MTAKPRAEFGSYLPGLSRERPHHRTVPFESRHAAEERRLRLDAVSLRGVFNQQIQGSKRSLRSVEDFTEFEQRTAYFNRDEIHAIKKGMNILDRVQVSHWRKCKICSISRRRQGSIRLRAGLTPRKRRRTNSGVSRSFSARANVPVVIRLHLERFLKNEPGDGLIKAFTLRGIKDSPPYMHHGRCLTLEHTLAFFDIVLRLKLSAGERRDLVLFMRQL